MFSLAAATHFVWPHGFAECARDEEVGCLACSIPPSAGAHFSQLAFLAE